jgi:hypothetical protein
MICFEVKVNGRHLCTAGVGEPGMLHAILGWVHWSRQDRPQGDSEVGKSSVKLDLTVSGSTPHGEDGQEFFDWLKDHPISVGDEVSIRVLSKDGSDPPATRRELTTEDVEAGERAYYERKKAEYEGEEQNTFEEPNEGRIAARSQHTDPATGRSYEIHLSELIKGESRWDDAVDVELVFQDGCRYVATFFRDPQGGTGPKGRFSWDKDDMLLIPELSHELMIEAVSTFVAEGHLDQAFRRVSDRKA